MSSALMTAVIFEGKEKLQIATIPRPECGPHDVLLEVAACGICGGDARSYFAGDQHTATRRIPGHEVAGTVAEAGRHVTAWAPGDRIALAADVHCGACWYCARGWFNMCQSLRILGKHLDGGLAGYMLLTPEILAHGIVNRVPAGLSLLHAAISEPLCSVLASHDELAIQAGETVAVIGCGPMGILHLELLRARQARVFMIDVSATRLALARDGFGAEITIDATTDATIDATIDASRADPAQQVRGLTEGVGADVVIVAAPSAAAVRQSILLVRKRGRVGLFGGLPAAAREVALDINLIHYHELRLVGNFSYHPRYHQSALGLLAAGGVRADQLITTYPIEETRQGLYDIRDGKVLKAVVVPNLRRTIQ
jgi:L-iditol 2-dehydrogenase